MNLRPSGYEPDELPGCSTPRYTIFATGKISRFFPALERRKGRFAGDPFGFGPDCVEKIIILRLADLAATYSPAS